MFARHLAHFIIKTSWDDRSCIHLDEAVPGLRLHELGLECGEAGARGEQVGGHGAVGHQHGEVLSITTQHLCSVYCVF